jgi:hypothetical protein
MTHSFKSSLLFAAALLGMSAVPPAAAAVHQLGAVNVSADHYTQVSWSRFDGPVARLSFVPDNDAVDCDHITINYRDGTSHDVFSGTLLKDQRETITFPGTDSRLRSVDFACKAQHLDGARISLSAVSDGERASGRYAERDDQDGIGDRPAYLRTYESANLDGR